MSDVELKPCPFCGGKAFVAREHCQDGGGTYVFVKCAGCRAKSGEFYFSKGNDCPQTYVSVREAWNTRATSESDALRAENKRLRDELNGRGVYSGPMIDSVMAEADAMREENAVLRTEKHADAEAIGAMQVVLAEIRDWRKSCIEYDEDMGHEPRIFGEDDLRIIEASARAALKGDA